MTTRRAFYCLIACGLVFAFYLARRADEANRGRSAPAAIATSVITGTWKADNGALFQFRSDGTGRSRDPSSPQFGINYFEWETDGTNFIIFQAPRGRLRSFIAHSFREHPRSVGDLKTRARILPQPNGNSVPFDASDASFYASCADGFGAVF